MSIPSVMFEAVKAFEPTPENVAKAIEAAITAGEKYTREVGGSSRTSSDGSFDPQKLREAAEEVWTLYMGVMHSKLLPKEVRETLPPLYAQEHERDPVVYAKFFSPNGGWTWFATEFDGLNTFFGLVIGLETELGYFLLSEFEEYEDPMGLGIERDLFFSPCRLSLARAESEVHGDHCGKVVYVIKTAFDPQTEVNPDPSEENPSPIAVYYTTGHYFLRQWNGQDWIVAVNNKELAEEVKAYITQRFLPGESGSWYPISKAIAVTARFPEKGDFAQEQNKDSKHSE